MSKYEKIVKYWKDLLYVVCYLSELKLCLWGYNKTEKFSNQRNYVIILLEKFYESLKTHLKNSTVFKGTSNLNQNDLISCLGKVVERKIKSEIEETTLIAIVLNETTDVTNISQLLRVVCSVNKERVVKESFLGFLNVTTQRTKAVFLWNCNIFSWGTKLWYEIG